MVLLFEKSVKFWGLNLKGKIENPRLGWLRFMEKVSELGKSPILGLKIKPIHEKKYPVTIFEVVKNSNCPSLGTNLNFF